MIEQEDEKILKMALDLANQPNSNRMTNEITAKCVKYKTLLKNLEEVLLHNALEC